MIEFRAILRKSLKFEGSFSLDSGTIIYARETPGGWLGTYYEQKGSAHSFALDQEAFSILRSSDCDADEIVVMPDPPIPAEKIKAENELARRRLQHKIIRHREQANELEKLLLTFDGEAAS